MRTTAKAFLSFVGLALTALGCNESELGGPCKTANQCGEGNYCVASRCQELGTGQLYFATDPMAGECRTVAVGGVDDPAARGWNACGNPCDGLGQTTCGADPRCQTIMQQPTFNGGCGACPPNAVCDCAELTDDRFAGPGVPVNPGTSVPPFMGCRPVEDRRPCAMLPADECGSHPECEPTYTGCGCAQSNFPRVDGNGDLAPLEECGTCDPKAGGQFASCEPRSCYDLGGVACGSRSDCAWDGAACSPTTIAPCGSLGEGACLDRRDCRAVGEACYCPPGVTCVCGGGDFLRCESDAPVGPGACLSDSDCAGGFTCNAAELCLPPPGCDPATQNCPAVCAGRCVPQSGCASLDEKSCNTNSRCAPKYTEDCVQNSYGCGGPDLLTNLSPPRDQSGAAFIGNCGCTPTYAGCVDLGGDDIVAERSLVVREPLVLDDSAYSFESMMTRLAGRDPADMVGAIFASFAAPTTINGRVAAPRPGVIDWLSRQARRPDGKLDVAKLKFRPMAITNRIDLVSAGSCGEARIVYATDGGVLDTSHRMTLIMEFGMPNDGAGCRTVAQRWASLSQIAVRDPGYATRLRALTDDMFTASRLNQLRTNELLTGNFGASDWQLREFKLVAGALVLQPCKNSPDLSLQTDANFLTWVRENQINLALGGAPVPVEYLAPVSTTDGNRFHLPSDLAAVEKKLNANTCNGCHATETATPFVHLFERRFPNTRAAMSKFMRSDLKARGEVLKTLLGDSAKAAVLRTRERPARAH